MNIKKSIVALMIFFMALFSCIEQPMVVQRITASQLNISDTIVSARFIEDFLTPYTMHLNNVLDSPLAYAPRMLSKDEGTLNSAIGNMMADMVYTQANPIYYERTGKTIDFVLLNHGGIRAVISKGNVTARTAYEVMPFNNMIVVLELSYEKIQKMLKYLIERKQSHPISSHLHITLDADGILKGVRLRGKSLTKDKTYYVATSDYLWHGGDNMTFFSDPLRVTETDYRIRDALIDYFKKTDTVAPAADYRFIKMH